MSGVIPGCDSDEEVFWGPVTAKELEIIWRSRVANKKKGESANPVEKFIKKTEQPNQSSGQSICSVSNNTSMQEVPSLQDLRNSSGNLKTSFEENNDEHHTEDSEHESVGNESTLPILEASMVINQDRNDIQNFSKLSGDSSNNDDIQIILHKHEGYVKCKPESSNQLDDSIGYPKLIQNINIAHTEDVEEKINSTVHNLNKIPEETTELHQLDDVCMSRINISKECHDPTGEGIETSDLSLTNCNISSTDDHNMAVELCTVSHNSSVPQQVGLVNAIDIMQPEYVTSKSENVESINLATSKDQSEPTGYTVLNQSNIENIPPEELNNDGANHKEVLDNLDSAENIGPIRKTFASDHVLNGDSVLQELKIENPDNSINSTHVLKIDLPDEVGNAGTNDANESSDEKSFVSINSEENCISSSNSQYSSLNQDCPETLIVKNKENEEPSSVQSNQDCIKSKIPVSHHIKSTFLRPAKLHHTPGTVNEKWLNDLKRKKIPKPKKPDYVVSPAKLGSILKSRNQIPANKPALLDPKRAAKPTVASSTPKPMPESSRTLLTPRKKQFEYVKSPISEYIRTGTGIPTAKSLPALQSPNKIPIPITAKQTPVQKLPPKFYSSAEKLVIKPGSSSSVLKPAENRLFLTPKIFKHQGRVADLKKPGDINVVTPRAVRKTSLTETSFACLPQSSKQLEISVLEEL